MNFEGKTLIMHSPISIAFPLAHVRDLSSHHFPCTHYSLKKLHIHQVLMTQWCVYDVHVSTDTNISCDFCFLDLLDDSCV